MFATTEAPSWNALAEFFGDLPLWAYRGQADADWPLETTLHRLGAQRYDLENPTLQHRESWVLYQFRRFAHKFDANLPQDDELIDWLALIQHYGGPTRLLDFTYSLYVAAFFATKTSNKDASIWAINTLSLKDSAEAKLGFRADGRIDDIKKKMNDRFQQIVADGTSIQAVIHVEPERMHERMWTQQGLFVAPTNPNKTFMSNLAATFGLDDSAWATSDVLPWDDALLNRIWSRDSDRLSVIKINIPYKLHNSIRSALQSMNINAATLFPGMEGFARSLRYHV